MKLNVVFAGLTLTATALLGLSSSAHAQVQYACAATDGWQTLSGSSSAITRTTTWGNVTGDQSYRNFNSYFDVGCHASRDSGDFSIHGQTKFYNPSTASATTYQKIVLEVYGYADSYSASSSFTVSFDGDETSYSFGPSGVTALPGTPSYDKTGGIPSTSVALGPGEQFIYTFYAHGAAQGDG